MWRDLEAEGGEGANILVNCGCLLFADERDARKSFVDEAEANLLKHGLDFEKFDSDGLRKRFPQMKFNDFHFGILDTGGEWVLNYSMHIQTHLHMHT